MTASRKIKLGKSPAYLRFLNWGLMGTAGAFMVINTYYTIQGLLQYPSVPTLFAIGIGAGLFLVEAAVTASVFSGSFQRTLIDIFEDENEPTGNTARTVRYAFICLGIVVGATILVFLYVFDYLTTYDGFFGAGTPSDPAKVVITLALNYMNEVCSFVKPIIEYQMREARIASAINRMTTEPEAILREHELRQMIAEARRQTLTENGRQSDEDPNPFKRP